MGDLYKTQVRQMARYLKVPRKIQKKLPTAGLWTGQTDEGEIGMTYAELDEILFHLVDERGSKEELLARGFPRDKIEKIMSMIKNSEFKRKLPPIAKISSRTIGHDFLYPYDWDK
jgi:NAD+ synthase